MGTAPPKPVAMTAAPAPCHEREVAVTAGRRASSRGGRLVREVGRGQALERHAQLRSLIDALREPLPEGEHRVAQEERRPRSQRLGVLQRAREDLVGRDDLVDEAQVERGPGIELLLGEREVPSAVDAEQLLVRGVLDELDADPGVTAVVVTGEGKQSARAATST